MFKNRLHKMAAYTVFCICIFVGGVYFYIFEFDYLFEPDPINIKLEKGNEIKFDINIKLSCVYIVGIRFFDKHGGDNNIRKVFPNKLLHTNLQALLDIQIINSHKKTIFSYENFGSKKQGVQYGPNPIGFVAGHLYLEPGKYSVIIKVNEVTGDFSYFDSTFFLQMNRKVKCL